MNLSWQKISTILGILVSLVVLVGGYTTYISKFAEAEDLDNIKQMVVMNQKSIQLGQIRLEQKILNDRIKSLEERRDRIEVKSPQTPSDLERVNEYNRDIRELEIQLRQLLQKMTS